MFFSKSKSCHKDSGPFSHEWIKKYKGDSYDVDTSYGTRAHISKKWNKRFMNLLKSYGKCKADPKANEIIDYCSRAASLIYKWKIGYITNREEHNDYNNSNILGLAISSLDKLEHLVFKYTYRYKDFQERIDYMLMTC